MTKKIGFIGLGSMGSALASRLLAQGYELVVYNRTPEKMEALAAKGAIIYACVSGSNKPWRMAKWVNSTSLLILSFSNKR